MPADRSAGTTAADLTPGRYVQVTTPRSATLDVRAVGPTSFHATVTARALNHGMPAANSLPGIRTRVARLPLPVTTASRVLRRLSTSPDEELDTLRRQLHDAWPRLLDASARLRARGHTAPTVDGLSLARVSRSGGSTVFVFVGDEREPSLVLAPAASGGRRTEAEAHSAAATLEVVPLSLGRVDVWLVQEGVGGLPMWVDGGRDGLSWSPEALTTIDDLHDKLTRLMVTTARPGHPERLQRVFGRVPRLGLDAALRRRVDALRRDLARLDVQVLEHGDVSAQNVMVDRDGRVTGIVDWEFADPGGVVGFDHLLGALSLAEHARGRYRWSGEDAYALLRAGWDDAPIFTRARSALRRSLEQTTGSDRWAEQVESALMLQRLTTFHTDYPGPDVNRACLLRSLEHVLG